MSKSRIVVVIYILVVIIDALFLEPWGAATSFVKTLSLFVWTIVFLITLFYFDKNERK